MGNVDSSSVAVDYMRERNEHARPEMVWLAEDVTQLADSGSIHIMEGSFGLVLDKACLDCLLCETNYESQVKAYLKQASRVLQPGGRLLCVSLNEPSTVVRFLHDADLLFTVSIAEKPTPYGSRVFLYSCQKRGAGSECVGAE